ncbi:hypothetical protein C8Z91_34750 [Paenibacillus elgii]|uniref:Butirosin biosynthesis protein H N-terminal domain-containing protein n=1 Tax=Paenibacillus elgii TaxID=189691 RepID=A0A2T6FRW8_9BACL|nr:hypothetical protein [Paenibacillus elgii]PUA34627.1 hypothetical protein C8Z91_34750 [Paenibacillus elgii]
MKIRYYLHNLFNCRIGQEISYLSVLGKPVERLFFDSLISLDDIYKHVFLENKKTWQFKLPVNKHTFRYLGVEREVRQYNNIDDAIKDLNILFTIYGTVFIWCDAFYLPRKRSEHGKHSVMLHSLEGYQKALIQDYEPYYYGYIPYEVFRIAFESVSNTQVTVFNKVSLYNDLESLIFIKEKYKEFLTGVSQNYEMFDLIIDNTQVVLENENLLKCYDQALPLLSGSRYLFAKFHEQVLGSPTNSTIVELLMSNYRESLIIKNILLKYSFTRKIDLNGLKTRVISLCNNEKKLLNILLN